MSTHDDQRQNRHVVSEEALRPEGNHGGRLVEHWVELVAIGIDAVQAVITPDGKALNSRFLPD